MKKRRNILAVLFLAACGDSESTNNSESSKPVIEEKTSSKLTMESFIQAFEDEGIPVDSAEKPYFEMINAKDGVSFYNQNKVVKRYEFESTKDIKAAKEENTFMKDWPENNLFVLETSDETAIDIFKNLK